MTSNKVEKPYIERQHNSGNGIQKLYRFPNNWGASVVRFVIPMKGILRISEDGQEYGSYTRNEHEWELAVICWNDKGGDYELNYKNPVARGDVVGNLTDDEVEKCLKRIRRFKPKKKL